MSNKLIESRKRADNAYREMDAVIASDKKVLQMANFENTTATKIERRVKKEQYEKRRQEYEIGLHERRQQLADLYNQEMTQWRAEILSNVETLDDRKARIMERAYALRDAREKERMERVKEKYDEQWRDACDDARTLDSKALTKYMNQERLRQIEEKIQRKQQLSVNENDFVEEWNRQLDEIERRDQAKRDHRKKVDHETAHDIQAQIEYNSKMKHDHFQKTRQEEEEELERLRMEIEREENIQKTRQRDAYQRGREVLQFNAENRKYRQEEITVEKERDAILLDYALRKEREAEAAEEAKRNANRQASLQFKKYLEDQMIKEAEDTAFMDEVIKREEERVWKARDDALQARQDARDYLMKQVDQGRQVQIREKSLLVESEKAEGAKFAAKFIDDAKEAVYQDKLAAEKRKQTNIQNNERLMQQMEYRRQKEELERQEIYLADKQMKYIERQHQQKLAEQGGAVRINRPLQKNSWYS